MYDTGGSKKDGKKSEKSHFRRTNTDKWTQTRDDGFLS